MGYYFTVEEAIDDLVWNRGKQMRDCALCQSNIKNQGLKKLAPYLANSRIKILSLRSNQISNFDEIIAFPVGLEILTVSVNPLQNLEFLKKISSFHSLQYLYLYGCDITDEMLDPLCEYVLPRCVNLKRFDIIRGSKLTEKGIKRILELCEDPDDWIHDINKWKLRKDKIIPVPIEANANETEQEFNLGVQFGTNNKAATPLLTHTTVNAGEASANFNGNKLNRDVYKKPEVRKHSDNTDVITIPLLCILGFILYKF